jgi:hypothetical protein
VIFAATAASLIASRVGGPAEGQRGRYRHRSGSRARRSAGEAGALDSPLRRLVDGSRSLARGREYWGWTVTSPGTHTRNSGSRSRRRKGERYVV